MNPVYRFQSVSVTMCVVVALLFALQSPDGFGQSTTIRNDSTGTGASVGAVILSDLRTTINDGSLLVQGALTPDTYDALFAGLVAGGAVIFFTQDAVMQDRIAAQRWNGAGGVFAAGQLYGDIRAAGAIGGGLWLCGIAAGDPSLRETGRMSLSALLYAGFVTAVVKSLSGRSRPYVAEGPRMFRPFQFEDAHTSFPSGHATVAFTLSTVLSSRIQNTAATIVLYSLAGLTAAQRVVDSKHWASDVFIGAVLGYTVGTAVVRFHENRATDTLLGAHMTVVPQVTPRGLGIALHVEW